MMASGQLCRAGSHTSTPRGAGRSGGLGVDSGHAGPGLESASWKMMVLFSAPLKCLCGSHLFQCLLLEVLWLFIWKLGDGSETRNVPAELARRPQSAQSPGFPEPPTGRCRARAPHTAAAAEVSFLLCGDSVSVGRDRSPSNRFISRAQLSDIGA